MASLPMRMLAATIIVLCTLHTALADDTLNPAMYSSPNGSWSIYVAPVTKNGDADWVGASTLIAFDRAGDQQWSAELFSPEDLACTTSGHNCRDSAARPANYRGHRRPRAGGAIRRGAPETTPAAYFPRPHRLNIALDTSQGIPPCCATSCLFCC